jgi:hypothetical protein
MTWGFTRPGVSSGRGVAAWLVLLSLMAAGSRERSAGSGARPQGWSPPVRASAACSSAVKDSTAGTHDDRHTSRPSASRTRTECRDAMPGRSRPAAGLAAAQPHLAPPVASPSPSPETSSPGSTGRQQPIHRPRSHGARAQQRLPFMCCNRPRPCGLGHFPIRVIRGQASSGNQLREARHHTALRTFVVATYRTSRGCSCNPGTPALIKHRSSLHEPTEGLPPHTLSRTANHRPPPSASVPGSIDTPQRRHPGAR